MKVVIETISARCTEKRYEQRKTCYSNNRFPTFDTPSSLTGRQRRQRASRRATTLQLKKLTAPLGRMRGAYEKIRANGTPKGALI